jgi:four helix bundle protein
VYQKAFEVALEIHELSKSFPADERFSLVDQIRRSSRSVCANMAEGWRRRRYSAAFVSKLNEVEGEAAETQVWLEFAVRAGYIPKEVGRRLFHIYDEVLRSLVGMINHPETWLIGPTSRSPK